MNVQVKIVFSLVVALVGQAAAIKLRTKSELIPAHRAPTQDTEEESSAEYFDKLLNFNFLEEGAGTAAEPTLKKMYDAAPSEELYAKFQHCANYVYKHSAGGAGQLISESRLFNNCTWQKADQPTISFQYICQVNHWLEGDDLKNTPKHTTIHQYYMTWCKKPGSCTDAGGDAACGASDCPHKYYQNYVTPKFFTCKGVCALLTTECNADPQCEIMETFMAPLCVPKEVMEEKPRCPDLSWKGSQPGGRFTQDTKAKSTSWAQACYDLAIGLGASEKEAKNCVQDPFDNIYGSCPDANKGDLSTCYNHYPDGEFQTDIVSCRTLKSVQALAVISECDERTLEQKMYDKEEWAFVKNNFAGYLRMDMCTHVEGWLLTKFGIDMTGWNRFAKLILKPVLELVTKGLYFVERKSGFKVSKYVRFNELFPNVFDAEGETQF